MTKTHQGRYLIGGLMVACFLAWSMAAKAEEATSADAVAEALDAGDPDRIDPNDVKGEAWTLDFQYEAPTPIVVTTPGGDAEVYWYVVYTVTNNSREDRDYVPAFTLFTDTAKVSRAGVYPAVFEAIKKKRKVAFLENPVNLVGKIRPGLDNARTGVAIFAPLDRKTDRFTIFVGGLSGQYLERPRVGETPAAPAAAPEPAAAPDNAPATAEEPATPAAEPTETSEPAAPAATAPTTAPQATASEVTTTAQDLTEHEKGVICLRKTLAIEYKLPGDNWRLNLDTPVFVKQGWTWR